MLRFRTRQAIPYHHVFHARLAQKPIHVLQDLHLDQVFRIPSNIVRSGEK
jgi:hypothetical protein